MNYSYMPPSVRVARLAEVEGLLNWPAYLSPPQLTPAQTEGSSKRKQSKLASRVDQLTIELEQTNNAFLAKQTEVSRVSVITPAPHDAIQFIEEGALSMAASATQFGEY